MIANIFGEQVALLLFGLLLFAWIRLIVKSSKQYSDMDRQNEIERQERPLRELEERQGLINHIAEAESLLPEFEAALDYLMQKFTWTGLKKSLHINGLEMKLLKSIINHGDDAISLPNLLSEHPGSLERELVSEADRVFRRSLTPYGDTEHKLDELQLYGYEMYAQSPTVNTLQTLYYAGLTVVEPKIDRETRSYHCSLTSAGRRLLKLEATYKPKQLEYPKHYGADVDSSLNRAMGAILRSQ